MTPRKLPGISYAPYTASGLCKPAAAVVRARLADPAQRIVVAETGWPHRGDTNGACVPSLANQAAALAAALEAKARDEPVEAGPVSLPALDVTGLTALAREFRTLSAAGPPARARG